MVSDNTSKYKSPLFIYIQLIRLIEIEDHDNNKSAALIGKLGSSLMQLAESMNTVNLEQSESGFLVQFMTIRDALKFGSSLISLTKGQNDFDIKISVHSSKNEFILKREIEKIISFSGHNEIVLTSTLNLDEIRESGYIWNKIGEIELDEIGDTSDVLKIDLTGYFQKGKINKQTDLSFNDIKYRYLIPVVVLFFIGIYFLMPNKKYEPTIAVWMMENNGNEKNSFWSWGMTEDIINTVGKSQTINIVPFSEINTAILNRESPKDYAKRNGLNYVLISEFTPQKIGFELQYSLINIKNDKTEYSKKIKISSKQISEIVGIISRKIINILDVNDLKIIQSRKHTDPEAYKLYLKGKYLINTGESPAQISEGFSLLEESIELDDNFLKVKSYLANLSRERGDLSKARDLYTEALKSAGDLGDRQGVQQYLVALGDILFEMEDFSNAMDCYRNSLSLYEELNHRHKTPYIMDQMALIYNHQGKPDSAIFFLEQSINISHELKDSLKTVSEILLLGNIYYNSGDYYSALIQFVKAREYSIINGDTSDLSRALHFMSEIFWNKKDFTQALIYQKELLELLKESGDDNSIAWAAFRIGSIYENRCDYGEAQQYLKESLKLRQKLKDRGDLAETISYLGLVTAKMGKYKKAQSYFLDSQKLYEKLRDRSGIGFMNHNLGETFYFREMYRESEGYFRGALAVWKELENPVMEIWSMSWLVLAELKSGNREFEVDLYLLNKLMKKQELDEGNISAVYYNLYQIYDHKNVDDKAGNKLSYAYNAVMKNIGNIQTKEDRNSCLENNILSKKIVQTWEKLNR